MTMNFFESWDLNTNFLIFLFFSEIRKRSYAETAQFQENFEVYIQALISQCLDGNFLDEVFNDAGKLFPFQNSTFSPSKYILILQMSILCPILKKLIL